MKKQEIISTINSSLVTEAGEINRLMSYLDYDKVIELIKAISTCKGKIIVTGCGTSAQIAKKIVHSLNCINVDSIYLNPTDAVHGSIGTIKSKDIVIFISKGGNTSQLCCFIDNVKKKQAKIVHVGENKESTLGKNSDIFIKVKVENEPDEFNMLATASSISVLALFDSICISIMKYKKFTTDEFEINHPQGAVGKRLKNRRI